MDNTKSRSNEYSWESDDNKCKEIENANENKTSNENISKGKKKEKKLVEEKKSADRKESKFNFLCMSKSSLLSFSFLVSEAKLVPVVFHLYSLTNTGLMFLLEETNLYKPSLPPLLHYNMHNERNLHSNDLASF